MLDVKPNSFWAKTGLKKGDVIRRVHVLQLPSVDNAMQAFDTMRKEEEVTMEISRAGTSQSIHWAIRQGEKPRLPLARRPGLYDLGCKR